MKCEYFCEPHNGPLVAVSRAGLTSHWLRYGPCACGAAGRTILMSGPLREGAYPGVPREQTVLALDERGMPR